MFSYMGQIILAGSAALIFVSTACVIRLTAGGIQEVIGMIGLLVCFGGLLVAGLFFPGGGPAAGCRI